MSNPSGFFRPTLQTLIDRTESDFTAGVPYADSNVRYGFLAVLARAIAGLCHGLYGYLDFINRQSFPDSSEGEYLERQAAIWNIPRLAATPATGTITVTGTNGTLIPLGTAFSRDDGLLYTSTANATISSGTAAVAVQSDGVGLANNATTGRAFTLTTPIAGVNGSGTGSTMTGGTDTETDTALRARLLARIQRPPHGGNASDYEQWALSFPGVTRAWVFPQELASNGVTVRFAMDNTYTDGIPLTADVNALQAYLEPLRPVTADITVAAPVATTLNFTIALRDKDGNTVTDATVRQAVTDELKDMIFRDGEPGGKLWVSRMREAISLAAGEFDHTLTSPSVDVDYTTGQLPVFGAITWS